MPEFRAWLTGCNRKRRRQGLDLDLPPWNTATTSHRARAETFSACRGSRRQTREGGKRKIPRSQTIELPHANPHSAQVLPAKLITSDPHPPMILWQCSSVRARKLCQPVKPSGPVSVRPRFRGSVPVRDPWRRWWWPCRAPPRQALECTRQWPTPRGVTKDYRKAANWYRLAAEQGDVKAQFGLAVMYAQGQGVPQDYVQAHLWANLAAAGDHLDALKLRDRLALRMSTGQVAEAHRLAREWKPKSSTAEAK